MSSEPLSTETVQLEINLSWSYVADADYTEEYDTGVTVAEWNNLSDERRSEIMNDAYLDVVANQNMGGIRVLTTGAKD